MSIIAISYGNEAFKNIQRINFKSAILYGCDKAIAYTPQDLSLEFKNKFQSVLAEERGCGLWCWKPYIMLKTLQESKDNDVVIYTDAGSSFVHNVSPLIQTLTDHNVEMLSFTLSHDERPYTKNLLLKEMDCNTPEFISTPMRLATFLVMRKSNNNINFLNSWLKIFERKELIDNSKGQEVDGFIEHRHDQSVYSLLCKKRNVIALPDPSQWGNGIPERPYPQIFDHHRHRDYDLPFRPSIFIDASFTNARSLDSFLNNRGYDKREDASKYHYYVLDRKKRRGHLSLFQQKYPLISSSMIENENVDLCEWIKSIATIEDYIVLRVTGTEDGKKIIQDLIDTRTIGWIDELYTDFIDQRLINLVKKYRVFTQVTDPN